MMLSRAGVRCWSASPHALPSRGAYWNECLKISSHTVDKLLFFARRVTLGSSEIPFIEVIVRRARVVDRRPRWRGVGANNSVPPVCVMHRSRVRRATQGDQKAQGQNRTHRFSPIDPVASRSGRSRRGRLLFDLAIITPIVSSHRRGRTSVIWVEAAHLTVSRRPALVHRIVAAIIVSAASPGDDVQANGKSRIICLSFGGPCC
jgi:hypothetical protein